jgi:restriction system protein
LVEAYFEKTGWRTQLNRTGPDGGVDVNLFKPDQEGVAAVVQCKAWNTYKVGIKPVRELLGVMAAGKIPEGYFVTTDIFTYEAIDFAKEQPLTLLDGYEFLRRIHALQKDEQTALLDLATAGDYKTPTCPSCGRKMVKRVSGKGRNIGDSFWGCPSFPRCRARLNMKRA